MSAGPPRGHRLLNLHLKLLALFHGFCEAGHEFWDFLKILQIDDLDGGMHVTVGQADKRAGNTASGPENDIGIGAAGGADSLMLQGNPRLLCNGLNPLDDFRMITGAMTYGWACPHLYVTVCARAN